MNSAQVDEKLISVYFYVVVLVGVFFFFYLWYQGHFAALCFWSVFER